jgi:pyruvate/2-oxoglutarate dehydrogenase complex dihydrolipoamide dehydrogenase (E3) component
MPVLLPRSKRGDQTLPDWRPYQPAQPEFDVVIIGGGSAGYAAARVAGDLGARTALIEGGEKVGGLCILRGCMPSKALLESAHRWHAIGKARQFGLLVQRKGIDFPAVQARKDELIGGFAHYRHKQLKRGKFTFLRGRASFLDPHTLLLQRGGRRELLTAATFILSTGSVIQKVPVPGLWETGCWTSDTALEADHIPKRLAVLGGGVIAVELGQFFARMGSKTTVLQRSGRLVRSYDPDVSFELERAFRAEDIDVTTDVKLLEVRPAGKAKKIIYERRRVKKELIVDEILYAMGRVPALDGLQLDNAGVAVEGGHLKMEPNLATSAPHIFAAGDVAGPHEVVHIAIEQGECAARNAVRHLRGLDAEAEKVDYRIKALVTFTEPEIASVGLTETEAKNQGILFISAKYPFNDHGKAMIGGYDYGFVKIIAEKTRGEIIGAEIIGPHASDLIHELVAVMYYHGTVQQLAKMPHYHPTLAEIVTYPAEELAQKFGPVEAYLENGNSPAALPRKPAVRAV